jgi:hypothetical protein
VPASSGSSSSSRVIPLPAVIEELGESDDHTGGTASDNDDDFSLSGVIPHAGHTSSSQSHSYSQAHASPSERKRTSTDRESRESSPDAPPPQQSKTSEGQAVAGSTHAHTHTHTGVDEERKAEAAQYKSEGNRLFSLRKYAAALIQYNNAVACDPENHLLFTNQAVVGVLCWYTCVCVCVCVCVGGCEFVCVVCTYVFVLVCSCLCGYVCSCVSVYGIKSVGTSLLFFARLVWLQVSTFFLTFSSSVILSPSLSVCHWTHTLVVYGGRLTTCWATLKRH